MRHDFIRPSLAGSAAARRQLFPDIEPYRTGWLKVSNTHDIYFEECGSPFGKAGADGSWRSRRRLQSCDAPLSRPCAIPDCPLRPARLRAFDAPCLSGREHHLGSRRRYGTVAHAPRQSKRGSSAAAPGARHFRWPTRRPIRTASPSSLCAVSSCCGRPRSIGSIRKAAAGFSLTPSSNTPPRSRPPNAAI